MKLLTKAIRRQLPPLGSQESKGLDAVAWVKFFTLTVAGRGTPASLMAATSSSAWSKAGKRS